jgi:hypothetical protein
MPPDGPETRRGERGDGDRRNDGRWVAERADEARCGERFGSELWWPLEGRAAEGSRVAARLGAGRSAEGRPAVGRLAVGRLADGRLVDGRLAVGRFASGAATLRETRAVLAERSDEGRGGADRTDWAAARGALRSSRVRDGRRGAAAPSRGAGADVEGRPLRAAGVTAVGVIWSNLQLAGGAQVRRSRSWV